MNLEPRAAGVTIGGKRFFFIIHPLKTSVSSDGGGDDVAKTFG